MLVICAIERANEVDKQQHSKRPNILFYLIKNMSDDLFGTSTKDKKVISRKRPRSEQ
jgi:hypothetical protein